MENHRDISNVMQIEIFQQVFEIKSQLKTNMRENKSTYGNSS